MSDQIRYDLRLRPKDPHDWRWKFLEFVAYGDGKGVAAEKCNRSRQCVDDHLKKHPNFKRRYRQAVKMFADRLQTNLHDIATTKGHLYSYPALIASLRALKPELYDRKPKAESVGLSPEQAMLIFSKILKEPEQLDAAYEAVKSLIDDHRKKER